MASLYLILGIEENATDELIEKSFSKLRKVLAASDFKDNETYREQARLCLDAFEMAYKILSDPDLREKHDQEIKAEKNDPGKEPQKPRIGQLCVASGIITVEQLEEVVEAQIETGLPLGEVLENKHYLSRAELEGLLMGQDLIDLDNNWTDPLARRMLALELVNEDMLLVAQMETKAQGASLKHAIERRGWVSPKLLEILSYTFNEKDPDQA